VKTRSETKDLRLWQVKNQSAVYFTTREKRVTEHVLLERMSVETLAAYFKVDYYFETKPELNQKEL
jgi:hypothetical protein